MRELIESILAQYGSTVTICRADGSEITVLGFVQPVTSKGWQNMQKVIHSLGQIPTGQYVYIGPADGALAEDDIAVCMGQRYRVMKCEVLCLADEELYSWGLLRKAGGEDPWNS